MILSHNRPHNLKKSLPILETYPSISEIQVFHGIDDHFFDDPGTTGKIIHKRDFVNNELYGAARRWFHASKSKEDLILFIDDDLIPTESWIINALQSVKEHDGKPTIYGVYPRQCTQDGYMTKSTSENYDTIITSCAIIPKHVVMTFLDMGFPVFRDWFRRYKGNCEDLAINLFVRNYYQLKPVLVEGTILELDKSNGYHNQPHHYSLRSQFCQSNQSQTFGSHTKDPLLYLDKGTMRSKFQECYKRYRHRFHTINVGNDTARTGKEKLHVDAIYCIYMNDRFEHVQTELKKHGFVSSAIFFQALLPKDLFNSDYHNFSTTWSDPLCSIYYKHSKLPVHLSYLMCMYHAMQQGFRRVLILEDDIRIQVSVNTVNRHINEFVNILQAHPSIKGVLYLGYCHLSCSSHLIHRVPLSSLLDIGTTKTFCKHAILHDTSYFPHFFENIETLKDASDHMFGVYYNKYNIKRYVTPFPLIVQDRNTFGSRNENFNPFPLKGCDFREKKEINK